MPRLFVVFLLLLFVAPSGSTRRACGETIDFARDIRPILSENCFFCHGPDPQQREADLRLDTESGMGAVIEPGRPGESELLRRLISHDADQVMPPPGSNRQLTPAQIERIGRWIEDGAQWQVHWSFQALVAPDIPTIEATPQTPIANPIDAFVQQRLSGSELAPSPAAERHELIRRLSLDLTGLPPTPTEVDGFVSSDDPQAYARLVDRLLDSPQYGQRMAWEWLDAARYADTNGYQGDNERTMWPWRDWVVRAFNQNMPFDQFTLWQLAGDLLPQASDEQILATGFLRNHMINGEGGRIAEENRVEYVFDMAETTSTVWLGLTMNCCRCHDHKYDPLTQQDYYRWFAFFDRTPVTGQGGDPQTAPNLAWPSPEQKSQRAALAEAISRQQTDMQRIAAAVTQRPPRPRTALTQSTPPLAVTAVPAYQAAASQLAALQATLGKLEKQIPKVMVMQDMAQPRRSYVLERGLYNKPTVEVTPAPPAFLTDGPLARPDRLAMAQWIIADENPLMPRVTVNRLWQQFFGIGLVKTAEDFGAQGEIPEHLDLLNWLAAEFRDSGWDVKALIRTIVTSHTYRQSSKQTSLQTELDPHNRRLSRGARYRLPAWMLRDQALAAGELLSPVAIGPAVNSYQPAGVWEEATFGKKSYTQGQGEELYRRSLFIFWRRIIAPTMFFDNASRQTCTVNTLRTNTPLQALLTLNETTYVEVARALAERVLTLANRADQPLTDAQRLDAIMRRVLARPATATERQILLAGLQRTRRQFEEHPAQAMDLLSIGESPRDQRLEPSEHASWAAVCLTVLNLDETLNHE